MTPATAFLRQRGIAFSEHEYGYVEHGGTEVPAQAPARSADLAAAAPITLVDVALS